MAIATASKEKSVVSDGIHVVYDSYPTTAQTASDRPVLVFIHGWTCSSKLWHGQTPLFTTHRSIVIDLPGHGRSTAPDVAYHVELFARAVNAVLSAESITAAVLLGHSLGGPVATMALRLSPDRVKGVIYLDSFLHLPQAYLTHAARTARGAAMADDKLFLGLLADFFTTETTEKTKQEIINTMGAADRHVRCSVIGTSVGQHVYKWDEVYDVPALHIGTIFHKARDEEWSHHMPNLEIRKWDGYGHFMFMEDPQRFNREVEEWLERKELDGAGAGAGAGERIGA